MNLTIELMAHTTRLKGNKMIIEVEELLFLDEYGNQGYASNEFIIVLDVRNGSVINTYDVLILEIENEDGDFDETLTTINKLVKNSNILEFIDIDDELRIYYETEYYTKFKNNTDETESNDSIPEDEELNRESLEYDGIIDTPERDKLIEDIRQGLLMKQIDKALDDANKDEFERLVNML